MSSAPAPPGVALQASASRATARWLLAGLALVLAVRLATLGTYPLADTSEARYGEIARVMRETGNWVTPQETPGTPFWAKPPLYAWLSATSISLLGINEFALRLPSLLCGFAVLALCGVWTRALAGSASARAGPEALLACLILSTTVLFFIGYGSVMTDPALGLATAWMLVEFHRVVIDGSRRAIWRYGFFVAAGLAMLAKGPVAFLYVALPVAVWVSWRKRWRALWQALPWIVGGAISAAISLPWYMWAEVRTPGFLNYFLVGEHLMRYLQPGWKGDRYGTAHEELLGTIWAYLAGALGLWTALLLALVKPASGWVSRARAWCRDDGRLFALLATLLPLLVFTFARNLIWTYVMPVLTPLAALLGLELAQRLEQPGRWRRGIALVACASVALVCLGATAWAPLRANGSSFARPVSAWRQQVQGKPGALLYWGNKAPASLRFYSRGAAEPVPDLAPRLGALPPGARVYVAIVPEQLPAMRQAVAAEAQAFDLTVIGQVKHAAIVEIARTFSAS